MPTNRNSESVSPVPILPDDLKTNFIIDADLISSNLKEALSRALADRIAMRNKHSK
ncbi:hypothetical protein FRX31_034380, partial [Thalictrum thalictroides]